MAEAALVREAAEAAARACSTTAADLPTARSVTNVRRDWRTPLHLAATLCQAAQMTGDKAYLLESYPDQVWRQRFLDLTAIVGFLHGNIINDAYKPSDELNASIVLTALGDKAVRDLHGKDDVPVKEARLLCLLITAHTEPLIAVDRIDIARLAKAVSLETLAGHLLYPFRYGRTLYDRFADQHQSEQRSLSLEDTLILLEDQPIGVYQSRKWLLGPYGMLTSNQGRSLSVDRSIPLQHCADPGCRTVHEVQLETSTEALINKHRPLIHKYLEKVHKQPWEWGSFAREVADAEKFAYDDLNSGTLAALLGDSLGDEELRNLLRALLDTGSGLRSLIEPLGLRGRSSDITAGLGHAQMLQLILLLDNGAIIAQIDELTQRGVIAVPRTEIRRPVVNAAARTGAWQGQVELGSRGIRVAPAAGEIAVLRLQRLISDLYETETTSAAEDLGWLLREVEGPTLEGRLAEFLRRTAPAEVVRRLIATRRDKVVSAAARLRFTLPGTTSDDTVVEHILWRLGFSPDEPEDPHSEYWRQHAALEQRLTTAAVSPLLDEEAIRSLAANYFVALEHVLVDSLHFIAWAMTYDHFASDHPFVYRPSKSRAHSLELLNILAKGVNTEAPDYADDKVSLYSLCLGFKLVAGHLTDLLEERAELHTRPTADRPERFAHTTLQAFPFGHTIPFMDLQPESQRRVVSALNEVATTLLESRISEIRNQQLHFRRSRADSDRFLDCLRAAQRAVRSLETSGFTRLEFDIDSREADEWDRVSVTFRDRRDREVTFARPSRFEWCSLPDLNGRQYLVTSATFAEPNEMLRFKLEEESLFASAYDNYPRRPRQEQRAVASAQAKLE
jgi:hypothetical protein